MSFAPQGGVSEASASRSSHPFRRSSGRNGTSERKREREVSERPASSITSSGHRLSPPSCDHCWWLKGLEVIRKIWEVNLGFHGRFLPVYHLFPSSTRFLSSYLRSSGCRSSTSLSIHLLRRNEGTEVSEWRTEEGKNGVRNGLSSLIHFAVLSPLLCHSARYTHLVPRSGLSGMRRSDEDRGEKSRVPAVRRFGSPHVISARFLRMSFTPFTRRSRSGGRKWTGVSSLGMRKSRGMEREQRTEASGLLTALTSVPWSSCSVHRVSFPPSLRPPVGSSIPSLRPPDGTNDVSDVRWTEGGDGVGRDSSWLERRDQKWIMGRLYSYHYPLSLTFRREVMSEVGLEGPHFLLSDLYLRGRSYHVSHHVSPLPRPLRGVGTANDMRETRPTGVEGRWWEWRNVGGRDRRERWVQGGDTRTHRLLLSLRGSFPPLCSLVPSVSSPLLHYHSPRVAGGLEWGERRNGNGIDVRRRKRWVWTAGNTRAYRFPNKFPTLLTSRPNVGFSLHSHPPFVGDVNIA